MALVDYTSASSRWVSKMLFLCAHNIGDRYRRTNIAAILALLEPPGVVVLFALSHTLLGGTPPFGQSMVLFYASGIIPFYLFFHVSWRVRAWDYMRRLPQVNEFEFLLVQVIPEVLTKTAILVITDLGLLLFNVPDAIPAHPVRCVLALMTLAVIGTGVGLINAVISAFFFAWLYIYAVVMRAWMAFSAVMFVVDLMPANVRAISVWIPITHGITWFRAGQYNGYPVDTFNFPFLMLSTGALLLFGWVALEATQKVRPGR